MASSFWHFVNLKSIQQLVTSTHSWCFALLRKAHLPTSSIATTACWQPVLLSVIGSHSDHWTM